MYQINLNTIIGPMRVAYLTRVNNLWISLL